MIKAKLDYDFNLEKIITKVSSMKIINLVRKLKQYLHNKANTVVMKSKYLKEYNRFFQLFKNTGRSDLILAWENRYMIINEDSEDTKFDRHYVYHTAWAARKLAEFPVQMHIDISSCLRFNTIASAFVPIAFYDYRPVDINLSQFQSKKADLLNLDFIDNSINSLSCMHVIEHIGLGRYGDPLDPNGDIKAIKELIRVLAKHGNLYIVVPIGEARICFNAHRIYNPISIIQYFNNLKLIEFACVPDNGHLMRNVNPEDFQTQKYACGLYHFRKM